MLQNDWILANMNNPDTDISVFQLDGLNTKNTQLLPKEEYLKSNAIINSPAFKDDNGNFSKDKFSQYYDQQSQTYKQFASNADDYGMIFDMFDTTRKSTSRLRNPITGTDKPITAQDGILGGMIKVVPNPTHQGWSVGSMQTQSDLTKSQREIAEMNQIVDSETGKSLGYSPNDISFFNNPGGYIKQIFKDPLVLATWDSDGTHVDPLTGEKKQHKKGETKTNENGDPYYETLNGRNPSRKQVLSMADIITVDGSKANKYDFFDSDDLDKSVTGTIFKTAAAIAPMLLGGEIAVLYGAAQVARESFKTLPMLSGMLSSLFTSDDVQIGILNRLAGNAMAMTGSTSDASQASNWTIENMANLIEDVALQWGQQKAIVKGISKLRGDSEKLVAAARLRAEKDATKTLTSYKSALAEGGDKSILKNLDTDMITKDVELFNKGKWAETSVGNAALTKYMPEALEKAQKIQRVGQDMSLVYMAAISNTDVYQSMLDHGASKREASLVALMSSVGMFGVDKYAHLGEMFFDETKGEVLRGIRASMKQSTDRWAPFLSKEFGKPASAKTVQWWRNIGKTASDLGKNAVRRFVSGVKNGTLGLGGKALGEGLEEVSEEIVADVSKQLYQWGGDLGIFTTNDVDAFNGLFTDRPTDWKGLGERYALNFIGGFVGGGIFGGVEKFQRGKITKDEPIQELAYYVNNGHIDDVRKVAKQWHDEGKYGSTTLSATEYTEGDNGTKVRRTAQKGELTENDYVYKQVLSQIDNVDAILHQNNSAMTEQKLFQNLIMGEQRFKMLESVLKDESYETGYQETYRQLQNQYIQLTNAIAIASKTKYGTIPSGVDLSVSPETTLESLSKDQLVSDEELRYNDTLKAQREQNINNLIQERDAINEQLLNFKQAGTALNYLDKLLFKMDTNVSSPFTSTTFSTWLENNYHIKDPNSLNQGELTHYIKEYQDYKQSHQKIDLDTAFSIYQTLRAKMEPELQKLNASEVKKYLEGIEDILKNPDWLSGTQIDENGRLEGESDEDYEYRNKIKDGETEEDFQNRRNKRFEDIYDRNVQKANEAVDKLLKQLDKAGGQIDPITQRYLVLTIGQRLKDTIRDTIKTFNPDARAISGYGVTENYNEAVHKILEKYNGKNLDELKKEVEELVNKQKNVNNRIISDLNTALSYLIPDAIYYDYFDPVTGKINFEKFVNDYDLDNKEINDSKATNYSVNSQGFVDKLKKIIQINSEELVNNEFSKKSQLLFDQLLDTYIISQDPITGEKTYDMDNGFFKDVENDFKDLNKLKGGGTSSDFYISSSISAIESNPVYRALTEVNNRATGVNPILNLIKAIGGSLGIDTRNAEELCNQLYNKFLNVDELSDFKLDSDQEDNVQDTIQLLKMAQSILISSINGEYADKLTIGHNPIINQLAKKHSVENFTPLSEISEDTFNNYYIELQRYIDELKEGWKNISDNNQKDKTLAFAKFHERYVAVHKEFWKANRDNFTTDGVDLLDGYAEGMSPREVETLLYDNFQTALKNGHTVESLLNKDFLKGIVGELVNLQDQKVCKLNDKLEYADFTNYDKLNYILTSLGVRSDNFASFLREKIQKDAEAENSIAPLDSQQALAQQAIAFIQSPEIYEQIGHLLNLEGFDIPIFDNILFASGVGGSGKSRIVATYIKEFLKDSSIWVGGNERSTADNLANTLGVTENIFDLDQLLEQITDKATATKVQEGLNNIHEPGKTKPYIEGIATDDNIKFNDGETPKILVFDETTWISEAQLALLNRWAKEKGVRIIGLGDNTQSGWSNNFQIANIDPETVWVYRTPKLYQSLRDINVQQTENITNLALQIDNLINLDPKSPSFFQDLLNTEKALANITYRYYNGDSFAGTMITESIPQDVIDNIKKDAGATVAFLGDTSSATYTKLKDAGIALRETGDDTNVFKSIKDIQGKEFDYIVVDNPFQLSALLNPILQTDETTAYMKKNNLEEVIKQFYTAITRGKKGSVVVDSISSTILHNKQDMNTISSKLLPQQLKKYRDAVLQRLADETYSPQPEYKAIVTPTNQTTSNTTSSAGNTSTTNNSTTSTSASTRTPKPKFKEGAQVVLSDGSVGTITKVNTDSYTVKHGDPEVEEDFKFEDAKDWKKYKLTPSPRKKSTTKKSSTLSKKKKSTTKAAPKKKTKKTPEEEKKAKDEEFKNAPVVHTEDDVKPQEDDPVASDDINTTEDTITSKDVLTKGVGLGNNFSIRIYGDFTLSGFDVREDANGKREYYVPGIDTLSSIGKVFDLGTLGGVKGEGQWIPGKKMKPYIEAFINHKRSIMNAKSWEDLTKETQQYFGKRENFENAKYYVVLRPKNPGSDRLIGLSNLREDAMENTTNVENSADKDNTYMYTVVMRFQKPVDGKMMDCEITLGALPNLETYGRAANNSLFEGVSKAYNEYKNIIDTLIERANKTGRNAEQEIAKPEATTYLIKEENPTPIASIKDGAKAYANAKKNGKMIHLPASLDDSGFSMIDKAQQYKLGVKSYIQTSVDTELGFTKTTLGHTFMLTWTDPKYDNMSEEERMRAYIKFKQEKNPNMPIRMMDISPRTVSFSSMINPIYRQLFCIKKGKNNADFFPQSTSFLGMRMFMQMWNTRAALANIKSIVQESPDFADVRDLRHAIVRKGQQLNKALDDANIPTFRVEESNEGVRIAEDGKVYLSNDAIQHMYFILDDLINLITDTDNGFISISKPNGDVFKETEQISTDSKSPNSLRKLYKQSNVSELNQLTINDSETGKAVVTFNFDKVLTSTKQKDASDPQYYNAFKLVPAFVAKTLKDITYYYSEGNTEKDIYRYCFDNTFQVWNKLDTLEKESSPTRVNKDISFEQLLRHINERGMRTTDVLNLFNVALSGTKDTKWNKGANNTTAFKEGIKVGFTIKSDGEKVGNIFKECATPFELMQTDVTPICLLTIKPRQTITSKRPTLPASVVKTETPTTIETSNKPEAVQDAEDLFEQSGQDPTVFNENAATHNFPQLEGKQVKFYCNEKGELVSLISNETDSEGNQIWRGSDSQGNNYQFKIIDDTYVSSKTTTTESKPSNNSSMTLTYGKDKNKISYNVEEKLNNMNIEESLRSMAYNKMQQILNENPNIANDIIEAIKNSQNWDDFLNQIMDIPGFNINEEDGFYDLENKC